MSKMLAGIRNSGCTRGSIPANNRNLGCTHSDIRLYNQLTKESIKVLEILACAYTLESYFSPALFRVEQVEHVEPLL